MSPFGHLQHAIAVILSPKTASFESERRLRLFEIARWVLLGGTYMKRKNASGIIYTAAEIACLGENPVDALRQALADDKIVALMMATMKDYDFYHLLFTDDRVTSSSMSKKMFGELQDAIDYGSIMLDISATQGSAIQEDVLLLRELRTARGETALKKAAGRYRQQLAFLVAADRTVLSGFVRGHGDNLLQPRHLITMLDKQLDLEVLLPFLSRVKTVMKLIDPGMFEGLKAAWPDVPLLSKDDLGTVPLSEQEREHIKRVPRRASEIKGTRRQPISS